MNQEIEKYNKERQEILQKVQTLDNQRNQLVTRLAEVQGILKYLQEKEQGNKQK